jgi:hypothetical protein
MFASQNQFDTQEQSYPEHLLMWTWRKLLIGCADCSLLEKEYSSIIGGGELLRVQVVFLNTVGNGSRRPLAVGHLGYLGVTPDERRMLALIAALQSGHEALLSSHLSWLVRAECRAAVTATGRVLARLLLRYNLRLPDPALSNLPPGRSSAWPMPSAIA